MTDIYVIKDTESGLFYTGAVSGKRCDPASLYLIRVVSEAKRFDTWEDADAWRNSHIICAGHTEIQRYETETEKPWSWCKSESMAHGDLIALEKNGHIAGYIDSMNESEAESIVATLNGTKDTTLQQQTISDLMDERDGRKIRIQRMQKVIDMQTHVNQELRDELTLVKTERDELLEQKERAALTREDHQAGQADLAHSSGEDRS